MIVAVIEGVSLTDLLLILGLAGIALDRLSDTRGWSRSSKTLRRENEDLVRRNGELEQTVARHEAELARLKAQVADLERTNQAAVLTEIRKHEVNAADRHTRSLEVLTDIRDTLKATA